MQTFLPFADFETSLSCLDNKRLGKQRVEAAQIINILSGNGKIMKNGNITWGNHPAVRQWEKNIDALKLYFNISVSLWVKRGKNNSYEFFELPEYIEMPIWLGHEEYHSRHRASLLFKKFDWYSQFGWEEKPEINYIWPSKIAYI